MKFGAVPVADAEGAVLAHSVKAGARRMKKGVVLGAADLAALADAGVGEITVARLETGDAGEDEAAQRIAMSLARMATGLRVAEPFTGRANLYAETGGCFLADRACVDALNRIDPAITLATLGDGVMVEAGRMVATVKIIPFAVAETSLAKAEREIARRAPIAVSDVSVQRVGLVATRLSSLKETVMDKTAAELARRLAPYGVHLRAEQRVAHEEDAVAPAIRDLAEHCDLVVIFGASAIVDLDDVIPAAIRNAGGQVHRFGMPVDPGNLLLTGTVAGTPVIGAPGCARSPAENGFDWVLRRVVHGVPIDGIDLSGMGVGGLLMEISDRPQPRDPRA